MAVMAADLTSKEKDYITSIKAYLSFHKLISSTLNFKNFVNIKHDFEVYLEAISGYWVFF